MTDALRERLQRALGPQYTLGRELGGGGMSRVFVARDEPLGRDVVVKLFSPDVAQELSVERFTREIRLAATLQHAHIVPVFGAGATDDGLPFYLMPYVEGESLRGRLGDGRPLPVADVVRVLRDVARALAYAHARGVVHRDIKPDNVMLSGGAAVVTDFGIAKALSAAGGAHAERDGAPDHASLTRMGTSLGTPAYMAPEQGTGDPDTDHRADVYALGATAYELLTGAPPFGRRAAHALLVAHLSEAPVPLADRRPDVPPALAALVMRCLAKDPAERPQTADELVAALEALGGSGTHGAAAAVGAATASGATAAAAPRSRGRRRAGVVLALVALLAAAGAAATWLLRRPSGMDAALLAVMPFNVRDSSLAVWHEGMVDVLSRSLDGAGALRTVSPSAAIARSPERADAAAAATVGRDLGAGLVLFGDLARAGGDSVHLRAAIFDVAAGRVRHDIDLYGSAERMDALADSLSLRVLRELGAEAGQGGTRLYAVGTRSLPALREFLRGQYHYRRANVDSARRAYQAALEHDSTFALAWRGVAALHIRLGQESSPEALHALERAIRHKRGLSPRDSLILRADSLRLAVVRRAPAARDALDPIPQLPELFATLRAATERYPTDAELWFELGDAGFHYGEFGGVSHAQALQAFERGIAADSSFVVPYYHAMDLSLRLGRTAGAAGHARRLGVLTPGEGGPYFRLLAALLASPPPFSPEVRRLLDSLPARHAAFALTQLATTPDSAAAALQLARLQRERPSPRPTLLDSTSLADALALAFAARGRFADAAAGRTGPLPPPLYLQLAVLGGVPPDSAAARAARWLRSEPARAIPAARLWAERGDTLPLLALVRWADSMAAMVPRAAEGPPTAAPAAVAGLLRAYLTLARGDSAAALEGFLALPMSACGGAPCAGPTVARLLADAGREQEAARVLDRWLPSARPTVVTPPAVLLRARLAESLGDEERAIAEYRAVLALWREGDAPTRPVVAEAEAALRRLTGQAP